MGDYDCQLFGAHVEYSLNILFLHLDDEKQEVHLAIAAAISALSELDHEKVKKYAAAEAKNMKNPERAAKIFQKS